MPIPRWAKILLVPIWNRAVHAAWLTGLYAGAIVRGRIERCCVCGRRAPILYRRSVIPPKLEQLWGLTPRQAEALARKESSECGFCGAKLRGRRLGQALLVTFPVGEPPAPARSVKEWVRTPQAQSLRIAELNRIDGLHQQLAKIPGHVYAEYFEGVISGDTVCGVRAEDLTRLSFADGSLDLVLTSETLEHVPDLNQALHEIHRVLAPGGWHIFTIPFLPNVPHTFARTVVREDGTLDHLAPRICHPGGDTGYPVFTEFGADLPELLQAAGFEVTIHFGPTTDDDLAQVHVCGKRAPGPVTGNRTIMASDSPQGT